MTPCPTCGGTLTDEPRDRNGALIPVIRDYTLIIEDGQWDGPAPVRTVFRRVRAYTAEDAKAQFRPTSFNVHGPLQRLINVVPYEKDVHGDLYVDRHVRT